MKVNEKLINMVDDIDWEILKNELMIFKKLLF